MIKKDINDISKIAIDKYILAKSDPFKYIVRALVAGFEHSIANMGIFSISYFVLGSLPMNLVLKNLFWVTLGNIIGGGVLLALPIKSMSINEEKNKNKVEVLVENIKD